MKIKEEYFKSYGTNHFVYDALYNKLPKVSYDDLEELKLLKKEYKLFASTFLLHWIDLKI